MPPKSLAELITVLVLAPTYGFLATYLCHPGSALAAAGDQETCVALAIVVVFFSSYSLLSLPIPEVTPYGSDDSFSAYSHHYQRLYYQVLLGALLVYAEHGRSTPVLLGLLLPGLYWANFVLLVLQMIGWVSNPFVTALYALEQAEVLLFGGTPRASDLRILVSFMADVILVVIFTHSAVSENSSLTVVYLVAAYVTSKNFLLGLGLKRPFKIENEDQQRQQKQADIVFASLETSLETAEQRQKENQHCAPKTLIFNAVGFVLVLMAALGAQLIYTDEDPA